MAARVCMAVFKLCVFTEILLLSDAHKLNMHNVALNKTCGISSLYMSNDVSLGNCSDAINGNTGTSFPDNPPNCIHTAENDRSPFWWVNLGQKFTINTITIYGRKDYILRMNCVNVSLDGDVVKRFTDSIGWIDEKYNITVNRSGEVVNITRDCVNEGYTINICEVQVWVCDDGWYGATCTQPCGHCAGDSVCDKLNGSCMSCQKGFQLPLCKECADGWYDINCTQTCGNCYGGSFCDKVNGSCGSCETSFKPPFCKECVAGYYDESCSQTCGHCLNSTTCDPDNGTCLSGCAEGFKGGLCVELITSGQQNSSNILVGAVVGSVLAVIVAAFMVITVMCLRRKQQAKVRQSQLLRGKNEKLENEVTVSERTTSVSIIRGNKSTASVKPQTYFIPGDRHEDPVLNVYGNMREDTAITSQSAPAMTSRHMVDLDESNSAADLIEDTCVSPTGGRDQRKERSPATSRNSLATADRKENRGIYENLMTTVPICDSQSKMVPNKDKQSTDPTDEEEERIYNTEDIYASFRSLEPSSILDDLQKFFLARLTSGQIGTEFAEFRKSMQHPHEAGLQPENLNKNRFKALCAYDHSRVILRRPKGDIETDYINASYIKSFQKEKAYIATQGPRYNTVDDLWWMVWQENATQIIMLTNLKEGGKDKCEEYWPSVGTAKTYGHVTVTALKADTRADFVVRYFVLESKQGGDQRTVSQYHYMVWPDHGVPSTCSLVSFWRFVKARAQGAMPVVHCSAGVGRTGTYIALDIASDLRSHDRQVNVKDIVRRLREDRTLMVQTEEQYKFLYEVILEEHTSRATRMTFDQFDLVFPDKISSHQSRIDKELKVLKEMGQFVPTPRHTIAESKENFLKNRMTESLPDDSHLVYLMDTVPGRNQYINAVHMSSFMKRQGLILTQLPLPDTVVDMWRLVDGWDVKTIVSLGHKKLSKSIKNYCSYWPESQKDMLKTGQHTVTLMSTSALGDHITCFNLSLATKTSTPRGVRVLFYDDWAEVVPGSISDILQLIDILESWDVEEDASPVVVQCSDGVTRSGMFCALYDIINRARHDQEIDVYLPVRHVQRVRPQAVTTENQYHYCYQAAQEYKSQHSVYQNT